MGFRNLIIVALIIFNVVRAQQGNTCADPFPIASFPFQQSGTTVGFQDNFSFPDSQCPGITTATGQGSPDNIYTFTVTTLTDFTITVHNPSFSAVVYLFADCANVGTSCRGADNNPTPQIIVTLQSGTYYVVVDGDTGSGTYTLTVETGTAFFTSATMDTGTASTNDTATQPDKTQGGGSFTPGENCAHPLVVDQIPFHSSGDTALFLNYYTIPATACPYQTGERGAGSPDVSYSFTPNTTDIYTFILYNTTFDSVLSVVKDCNNINSTCLEGRDLVGAGSVETFALNLTQRTTYYIIVDGFSNDAAANVSGLFSFAVVAGGSLTVPTSAPLTSAQTSATNTQNSQTTSLTSATQTSQRSTQGTQGTSNNTNSTGTTNAGSSSSPVISQTAGNNEVSSVGMLKPVFACALLAYFYL